MPVAERHQKIIEFVNERKKLIRSHDGPVSINTSSASEFLYLERKTSNGIYINWRKKDE